MAPVTQGSDPSAAPLPALRTAALTGSIAHRLRHGDRTADVIIAVVNIESEPSKLLLYLGSNGLVLLIELFV